MNKSAPSTTPRFFKNLRIIGIIGVSLLILNFFYQLWSRQPAAPKQALNTLCDLQKGSCIKSLGTDGALQFSITPQPITAGNTFTAHVALTNIVPQQVALLLFPLSDTKPATQPIMLSRQSDGEYVAEIVIEKTNSPNQNWVAMVMLMIGDKQISAPFKFQVP